MDGKWTDWPYWYKERTQVGFLAAAVWQAGGTALEEYRKDKAHGSKGRYDLWINFKGRGFECEAKWGWLNLRSTSKDAAESAKVVLKHSEADMRSCRDGGKGQGLAIAFLTVLIGRDESDSKFGAIEGCLEQLRGDPDCGALLWIGVPNRCRHSVKFEWPYGGLLMVVKEVR
jgi:hypothetical protein